SVMSNCSIEQLHAFYVQERLLFIKLVQKFSRSLAESLLVMATWLWLEDFGFEHIFSVIMALNDPLIAALANEAVLCFRRNLFPIPSGIWGWNASCIATENDRTLFLTFSRGIPVSEAEVRLVFTEKYGENCVKGVHIPKYGGNLPNENLNSNQDVQQQSLYARLVLDSVVTVDRILMGESKQKFYIDGKPIWAPWVGFTTLQIYLFPRYIMMD
ncbi:hypothetical protein HID58_093851, partial [Brassica napus]